MAANILDALDDQNLFGGMFDAPSWKPWRAFLGTLFALPMDEDQIATACRHTGRTALPDKPARYAELVVGRRGGKSRCLALIASYLACVPDHGPFIVPGETPVIAVIAADRRQAKVILNYIAGFLREIPLFADMIADELAESVRLTNGVTIEVHTASIGAPRGRTFLACLLDEVAFWQTGDGANPDIEVVNAIRPGLSTIPYSLLLIASSPYAKRGVLYQNYSKYFGKDNAPVLVWQGTTREMNSSLIDDPLIDEMYEEDPERASAEFGAQFRSDIVAFITREAVEDVTARGIRELPSSSGISYAAFVDPSGGSADSMTLAIGHIEGDGLAVLDVVREVKPPFSPDAAVAEFSELLKSYGISRVTGDAYAGHWPRERFAMNGITYDVSDKNKSTIYAEFLPALNGKRVRLLDIPRLAGQLVGLERRVARGGRDSIDHAPGSNDDVANAVCGVLVNILGDRRPSLIRADDLRNGSEAVPYPKAAEVVGAVLCVSDDGMAAVVYFSYASWLFACGLPPTNILDFDAAPLTGTTIRGVSDRLDALRREIRCNFPVPMIFLPPELVYQARMGGVPADAFPDHLLRDTPGLALSSAGSVASGQVKICDVAMEKAKTHPLGGALNFRAGEKMDRDPLRLAVLLAIEMTLGNERNRSAA
ncbi:MAG TPA: hypothetical protein VNC39_09415 [Acidocella sp.]|jgi:hypothetical protein|uniref:hypothetical protein n=1 Tax=Acidocella sp. TaxID=50710 RepID=UPI002C46533F|nr:hypothetical protein [Acidocella sp.]HVE22185.1 hypothetical protein [Acidocella sp.]